MDNAKITISRETGSARNFQKNGNPDSLDITVRPSSRSDVNWTSKMQSLLHSVMQWCMWISSSDKSISRLGLTSYQKSNANNKKQDCRVKTSAKYNSNNVTF